MYNGIAVYNTNVNAYAEQLPIDEACRAAVSKGPAVEIPVNFGFQEIDENLCYYGSGLRAFIHRLLPLNEVEIDKVVEILNNNVQLSMLVAVPLVK